MYEDELHDSVSQGDIIRDIVMVRTDASGKVKAKVVPLATVLTRGCMYDKGDTETVQLAELLSIGKFDPGSRKNILLNKNTRFFYLEPIDQSEAMVVDFRTICSVRKELVEEAKTRRLRSLSQEGRKALVMQIIRYFVDQEDLPRPAGQSTY